MPKETWTCQLCGEEMDVDVDKRGNPYLNCFGCGVQTFIRRRKAMELFYERYGRPTPAAPRPPKPAPIPTPAPAPTPTPTPKEPTRAAPAKARSRFFKD